MIEPNDFFSPQNPPPHQQSLHLGPQAQVVSHGPARQRTGQDRVRAPREVLGRGLAARPALGGWDPRWLARPPASVLIGVRLGSLPWPALARFGLPAPLRFSTRG